MICEFIDEAALAVWRDDLWVLAWEQDVEDDVLFDVVRACFWCPTVREKTEHEVALRDREDSLGSVSGDCERDAEGGVFAITTIPGLMWLAVLGGAGYGAYLLYLGLPLMNGTPPEKAGGYAAAVMGCTMGAMMVMGSLMCVPMSCCMASALLG